MRDLQKDLKICQAEAQMEKFPAAISERCRKYGQQCCHICEDVDCGDNITPGVVMLRKRAMEAEVQKQELEVQCAAMREALEYADLCIRRERNEIESIPQLAKALSLDAGRDLLERIKKLETQRSVAKEALEKLKDLLPEFGGLDGRVWRIIDEALAALESGEQNA